MDVHVPAAVTKQLRSRGIDIVTAQEDKTLVLPDDELLQRSTQLGRVMFTQDIRFKALAEQWQRDGHDFGGLVFAHQLRASIGQLVVDLEIIAKVSELDDWKGMVQEIPLK